MAEAVCQTTDKLWTFGGKKAARALISGVLTRWNVHHPVSADTNCEFVLNGTTEHPTHGCKGHHIGGIKNKDFSS